jgi:hypothetical protein
MAHTATLKLDNGREYNLITCNYNPVRHIHKGVGNKNRRRAGKTER